MKRSLGPDATHPVIARRPLNPTMIRDGIGAGLYAFRRTSYGQREKPRAGSPSGLVRREGRPAVWEKRPPDLGECCPCPARASCLGESPSLGIWPRASCLGESNSAGDLRRALAG